VTGLSMFPQEREGGAVHLRLPQQDVVQDARTIVVAREPTVARFRPLGKTFDKV